MTRRAHTNPSLAIVLADRVLKRRTGCIQPIGAGNAPHLSVAKDTR